MTDQPTHPTDDRLLLFRDGELSRRERARVDRHLQTCRHCILRMGKVEHALEDFAAFAQQRSTSDNISGPRAILRARLRQSAAEFPIRSQPWQRLTRGLAFACAGLLLAALGFLAVRSRSNDPSPAALLPNRIFTPGSVREVSLTEICSEDREETVSQVAPSMQQQVFAEYGLQNLPSSRFEVDYLITPGLGGSGDVRNLWPEPRTDTWNSYVKDQLEDHLHRMVCSHQLALGQAQQDIAHDWIAAYKKYFHTDRPLSSPSEAMLTHPRRYRFALRRKQSAA